MNAEKACHVNGTFITPINGSRDVCTHHRVVDDHINEDGAKTGRPVCRECGEIIHKPVEA